MKRKFLFPLQNDIFWNKIKWERFISVPQTFIVTTQLFCQFTDHQKGKKGQLSWGVDLRAGGPCV